MRYAVAIPSLILSIAVVAVAGCGSQSSPLGPGPGPGAGNAAPAPFHFIDLGADTVPNHINGNGEVVGETCTPDQGGMQCPANAFAYIDGVLHVYADSGGAPISAAWVNDGGLIVGSRYGSSGTQAIEISASGNIVDLGGQQGSGGNEATAVNDAGLIVGDTLAQCVGTVVTFDGRGGSTSTGVEGVAAAVNASGTILYSQFANDGGGCLGAYSPAIYPGNGSAAVPGDVCYDKTCGGVSELRFNDNGDVTGVYTAELSSGGMGGQASFYTHNGTTVEIDPPGGLTQNGVAALTAGGLNNAGVIAGTYKTAAGSGVFEWHSGGFTDITAAVQASVPAGFAVAHIYGINDSGSLIGAGMLQGNLHGFVLVPVH